jgi:hypothetical protein
MCGIVGTVGRSQVAPLIVDALKRLEYRGYDSAGVGWLPAHPATLTGNQCLPRPFWFVERKCWQRFFMDKTIRATKARSSRSQTLGDDHARTS